MDLWFLGQKLSEPAPKAECVIAEGGAHPLLAGGGGVALVEDEIDHGEHGVEPLSKLVAAWSFKGDMRFGQCFLGSKDALA